MKKTGVLLILAAMARGVHAQIDPDLARIPDMVTAAEPLPAARDSDITGKSFIEDAATIGWNRSTLAVPFPAPMPAERQNRTTLDAAYQWTAGGGLSASWSDRFNIAEASDIGLPSHQMLRNDLKEGFVSWEAAPQTYLELGRINHRQGVSLGYSPTDYFKAATQVDLSSADPSVLRADRLGTAMISGQHVWDGGALTLLFAPKLGHQPAIPDATVDGMDPRFSQTNNRPKALLSVSEDIHAFTALASVYREGERTQFGTELTCPIGQSVIAYGEWSGGRRPDLIAQAFEFGKQTGAIPTAAPLVLPTSPASRFQNALSVGASWSTAGSLTVNLEYHFSQAGLSRQDWKTLFAAGSNPQLPFAAQEIWYVRDYANYQEEPLSRGRGFVRLDWRPPANPKIDLSMISFLSSLDASSLSQFSINYFYSDKISLGVYATFTSGAHRTEYGSSDLSGNAIFQIDYYL
jgi:hypothetical protein